MSEGRGFCRGWGVWMELAGFYGLVGAVIWAGPLVRWRPPGAVAAVLLVGWVVFSLRRRGWGRAALGWDARHLRESCRLTFLWVGIPLLIGVVAALARPWPPLEQLLYGRRGQPPAWAADFLPAVIALGVLRYPLWALVQESVLLSYLANRWRDALGDHPWRVALVNGTLFALIHAPNPMLMAVCWVSGTLLTRIFLKAPHVVPPALAHGFGGLLISLLCWAHPNAMTVGPSYWAGPR